MFVAAAHLRVPFFVVVPRKGYGLGAMAMTGGGFHAPLFTVAWPRGEFGAMGLAGALRLVYRKEPEALPEGVERDALYRQQVDEHYAKGKTINMAARLEADAVIDPADTRQWLVHGLASARIAEPGRMAVDPFGRAVRHQRMRPRGTVAVPFGASGQWCDCNGGCAAS